MTDRIAFDAFVFDVGGVIIRHDNDALFRRLAETCTAADAAARIAARAADPQIGTGAMPVEALHAALRRELGYRRDWDAFLADWSSHFTVDEGMLALVQDLAAAHRVLLFSNTNAEHWRYVVAMTGGALGKFEAYLSHELGQAKPAPDAFRTVAARAKIGDPGRALFVDDLAENVEAARSVGFQGHVFRGRDDFERFLAGDGAG